MARGSKRPSHWIPILYDFIQDLRITSKELNAPDGKGIKLELWDSQKRFLNEIGDGLDAGIRIFNNLKSRQLGITTISDVLDVFWPAMYPGTFGALVADSEKNMNQNRAIISGYVKSFPEGYFGDKFSIVKNNKNEIEFSNGSRLNLLIAGTKKKSTSWAEGVGYSYVHLTEVGKYGDPEALKSFVDSFAQTNPNRLFIFESTANGFNHWRTRYLAGKNDTSHVRSFFIGWWASPMNVIARRDARFAQYQYPMDKREQELAAAVAQLYNHRIVPEQLAWIRWKEADEQAQGGTALDERQPWTEHQAFLQSGYSFFQTRVITQDMRRVHDSQVGIYCYRYDLGNEFFDLRLIPIVDDEEWHLVELKVWEAPVEGGVYAIGCDPAYGRNSHKDKSCIQIYRCYADKIVQVAEYATSEVEAKHCAWVLAHLAGAYRNCIVIPEITGPGRLLLMEWDHLRQFLSVESNAERVRANEWTEALDLARWYIYNRPDNPMAKGAAIGFETTWRTKAELMHAMRGSYVTRELEIRSIALLEEMTIIVQDGDSIGAPESREDDCKDDRVFATALSIRAWTNHLRPELLSQGMTYEAVESSATLIGTGTGQILNSMVARFFKSAEERAGAEPERGPKWMADRGLI